MAAPIAPFLLALLMLVCVVLALEIQNRQRRDAQTKAILEEVDARAKEARDRPTVRETKKRVARHNADTSLYGSVPSSESSGDSHSAAEGNSSETSTISSTVRSLQRPVVPVAGRPTHGLINEQWNAQRSHQGAPVASPIRPVNTTPFTPTLSNSQSFVATDKRKKQRRRKPKGSVASKKHDEGEDFTDTKQIRTDKKKRKKRNELSIDD